MPHAASGSDPTLESYEAEAELYIRQSRQPRGRLDDFVDAFASKLGSGNVLELGSGPGWDADRLEARGLRMTRSDGAPAFVERLRDRGHQALVLDVRTDAFGGPYDGVFANAVLLHLSRDDLVQVLHRLRGAVRAGGLFGFTLKEGDGDAWSDAKLDRPRHFVYWREADLRAVLDATGWRVVSLEHVVGRLDDWLYVLAAPRGGSDDDPVTDEPGS